MGLNYKNLDAETRRYMLLENEFGGHYASPRIEVERIPEWRELFLEALKSQTDDWLADQANKVKLMKSHETRRTPSGGITTAKVPSNAALQLAEGEFNRFYLRGIAARALAEGKQYVKVYRGKEVSSPRPESEARIGSLIAAASLLSELRKSDFVDNALGLPAGPNSGLTAEIA